MSSAGHIYWQPMSEESRANLGTFYVTNTLEVLHPEIQVGVARYLTERGVTSIKRPVALLEGGSQRDTSAEKILYIGSYLFNSFIIYELYY